MLCISRYFARCFAILSHYGNESVRACKRLRFLKCSIHYLYGIWMRNQGNGSFYAFLISSDGYFEYAKKDNGTWVMPSNWTKSSAIKTGEETNRLKVVAKGDKFDFYDNDVLLDSYVDSQFKIGWLGLWVGTQSEGNVTIGFDNFRVWSLKD